MNDMTPTPTEGNDLPPLTRGQAIDIAQRMQLIEDTENDLRSIDIYLRREVPADALRSVMSQLLYEDDAAFAAVAAEVLAGIRARKVEKAQALAAELGFAWQPADPEAEEETEAEEDEADSTVTYNADSGCYEVDRATVAEAPAEIAHVAV